jgi:small subunit ribosomal protein S1
MQRRSETSSKVVQEVTKPNGATAKRRALGDITNAVRQDEGKGNVTKKDDKGATVQLQYGLEAYAPARHLRKENGSTVEADEILPFVIIEFDRNDKRIVVSHNRIWEQEKADEKETLKKEAKADAESTKKAVKNVQSKVEKSTLGDIDVLAALKDKMKKDEESK